MVVRVLQALTVAVAVVFMMVGLLAAMHYVTVQGWTPRYEIAAGYCAKSGADSVIVDGYLVFQCEETGNE